MRSDQRRWGKREIRIAEDQPQCNRVGVRDVTAFGTARKICDGVAVLQADLRNKWETLLKLDSKLAVTGLDQIDVRVPWGLIGHGKAEVVLTVNGKEANKVTVSFE